MTLEKCSLGYCHRVATLFINGAGYCSHYHYGKALAWSAFIDEIEKGIEEVQQRIDKRERKSDKH